MPEAYEVGITLALQNGVSAGIELIQRDLAVLDRAIAVTSSNLAQLQAQAGTNGNRHLTQPASPQSDATPQPDKSEQPVSSHTASPDAMTVTQRVGPAPSSSSPRGSAFTEVPRAFARSIPRVIDPSSPRIDATDADIRTPTSSASLAKRDVVATAAPPANAELSGAPPPALEPQSGGNTVVDPHRSALTATSPQRRRIGPVALQQSPGVIGSIQEGGDASSPIPPAIKSLPAELKAAAPRFAARLPLSDAPTFRPAMPGPTPSVPPHATPNNARPPSENDTAANGRSRSALSPPPIDAAASRFIDLNATNNAAALATGSREATRPDERNTTQPGSFAPPATASQTISLQGDIIIDGSRLGRWMTSSLARQASRPPSSPVAPDPRQTPLWSGQAQGF